MISKETLKALTAKNQKEIQKLSDIGIGVFYDYTGGVTICFLFDKDDGTVLGMGRAYKNPKDPQNHRYGRFLSFIRAKIALTSKEMHFIHGRNIVDGCPNINKLSFLCKKKTA